MKNTFKVNWFLQKYKKMQGAHLHQVASTRILNDNALTLNKKVLARKTTLKYFFFFVT